LSASSNPRENLRPFRFLSVDARPKKEAELHAPGASRPILVAAFEGWNDAGEAASFALDRLELAWEGRPIAEIDPEDFYDFTESRPEVNVVDGEVRGIRWPGTVISLADGPKDVVIARGQEPQLRWRTYCDAIVDLARALDVERAVLLGAYLGEVTHRGPVLVSATATDATLLSGERVVPTYYEGPTGIIGVLGAAFAEAQIPTISLWASVPVYSVSTAAKAALSLAEATARLVGRPAELGELARRAAEYAQLLEELVANDENVASFVERVEAGEGDHHGEFSPEGLTEEIERFLRDTRNG
jgi:proteasome assembly chaperone (PAC2) family protein